MRIVYDVRPLQTPSRLRGIGTVTRRVLESLSAIDHENEYQLLRWPGDDPLLELSVDFRWQWLEVPRPRPAKLGWLIDRVLLGRRLRGVADCFHVNSPFDLDMGWPWQRHPVPRRVVTLYDLVPVLHGNETLRGKHRLLIPLFKLMAWQLCQAWRIVSISETTARLARENLRLGPGQVRVAPIGVAERFRPQDDAIKDAFRARMDLNEPFLLYVGGANRNKNLSRLLAAFERSPSIPRLVMLTRGFDAPNDGRVRVLHSLDESDVVTLYGCARLVVMPSLFEGFGLPVLEAMACGTPVVCSDIEPFREVGGEAVRYFPAQDVSAMAATLTSAWSDDVWRRQAMAAGCTRAEAFTWARCARMVLDVYRES